MRKLQLLDEVGTDAARFMFLFRSPDTPLDFDLEVAKSRSLENPVYYVQYAHARVCALERRAEEKGIILPDASLPEEIVLLDSPEDMALLRKISFFTEIVANSAKMLAPQYISRYLMELASRMHAYYGKYTIIDVNNPERTRARLGLLRAAAQTIANGLELLGVSAPEIM